MKRTIFLMSAIWSLWAGSASAAPAWRAISNLYFPPPQSWMNDVAMNNTHATTAVDSTNDAVGAAFSAPQTGFITHLGFNPFSYGLNLSLDTVLTLRLETVGSDGSNSGTLFDNGTGFPSVQKTYNAGVTGGELGWFWVTLGADSVSVTARDQLAFVIGAKIDGILGTTAGDVNILTALPPSSAIPGQLWPYELKKISGTAVRDDQYPPLGIKMSSVPVECGMIPVDSMGAWSNTFDSASTWDEIGMYFEPQFAMKVVGMWFAGQAITPTSIFPNLKYALYDSASTVLGVDTIGGYTSFQLGPMRGRIDVYFASEVTLTVGHKYRIAVAPLSTDDMTIWHIKVGDSADWYAWPGGGSKWFATVRGDSTGGGGGGLKSGWTQLTNRRFYCGLIISALSADAGGMPNRRRKMIELNHGWLIWEARKTFAGGSLDEDIPK